MWRRLSQNCFQRLKNDCHRRQQLVVQNSRWFTQQVTETTATPKATIKETYTPRKRKFNVSTALLCTIPFVTFYLGCWQVQRLRWKVNLIRTLEDRLYQAPIPLPKRISPDTLEDYEYRKVYMKGRYRHDQEFFLGPRTRGDGNVGYFIITPFERDNGTTVLVKRGWVSPDKRDPSTRPDSLVTDEVEVIGLIRTNEEKNKFTPENDIEGNQWYWADVETIAKLTNAQPIMIERVSDVKPSREYSLIERGIPVGRAPTVEVRNNHLNYLITWYSLSFATSIMLWRVLRRPPARPQKIKRL
ncbi:SURF1 family-domain-containing protein [Mycotypha africana]|uniref:SURF1 family-domain-containing protein n=1 Tax=Mycotypha africana TaxID=64632 RepID=UPI002301B3A7|nr:SURF1 family-domain-containing protein [Mycotypha africana]KAI8979619.1 SURF1 family-domain-containing protein [Mycotypha africana]